MAIDGTVKAEMPENVVMDVKTSFTTEAGAVAELDDGVEYAIYNSSEVGVIEFAVRGESESVLVGDKAVAKIQPGEWHYVTFESGSKYYMWTRDYPIVVVLNKS